MIRGGRQSSASPPAGGPDRSPARERFHEWRAAPARLPVAILLPGGLPSAGWMSRRCRGRRIPGGLLIPPLRPDGRDPRAGLASWARTPHAPTDCRPRTRQKDLAGPVVYRIWAVGQDRADDRLDSRIRAAAFGARFGRVGRSLVFSRFVPEAGSLAGAGPTWAGGVGGSAGSGRKEGRLDVTRVRAG